MSALDPKPFESRMAMSTEIPALPFKRSESACRVTPSPAAASVTDRPSGSRHWRRIIPPVDAQEPVAREPARDVEVIVVDPADLAYLAARHEPERDRRGRSHDAYAEQADGSG